MSGSLDDLLRGQGVPPKHPLLDRIERNPVGANRFEDSLTVPTPGIDPLAGFINGKPVTQGQANALPLDPISGRLNPSGEIVANALMGASSGVVPKGFRSFHGSPHNVDQFSTSKIGTGEGAQAYGHGLYFAENEAVAKSYRDQMAGQYTTINGRTLVRNGQPVATPSTAESLIMAHGGDVDAALKEFQGRVADWSPAQRQRIRADETLAAMEQARGNVTMRDAGKGHMYEVNIKADPAHFLDWDKPLSQQHPIVREALGKHGALPDPVEVNTAGHFGYSMNEFKTLTPEYQRELIARLPEGHANYTRDPRGSELYELIKGGDPVAAAAALKEFGVPGIRYADGAGRQAASFKITPPSETVSGKWMVKGDDYNSKGMHFDTEAEAQEALAREQAKITRNTVVFDDSAIEILRKYGLAGLMAGGGAAIAGDASAQTGAVEPGNIDLNARPVVQNADGSVSTVRSMSFNDGEGREVLIPTVSDDGRILSDDEAVAEYRRSGRHLGVFATPEAATGYAEGLHTAQERQYAPRGQQ